MHKKLILTVLSFFSPIKTVVGPGPHKIESEENDQDPDIQLLPQRDQPAPEGKP